MTVCPVRPDSFLALLWLFIIILPASALATQGEEALPEHPVIKPMQGAVLVADESTVEQYGELPVRYTQSEGQRVSRTVSGHYYRLSYQLRDAGISKSEIKANYISEILRLDGEVIEQTATRLRFRLFGADGATTWAILDTRRDGAYRLEIVDEAPLMPSLVFDEDGLREGLRSAEGIAVYGLLFDLDSSELMPGSGAVLDTIAAVMRADTGLQLRVQGHTDATGDPAYNRALSKRRAQRVIAALSLYGVAEDRLVAEGLGSDQPVASNETEEGRQKNRRVQLIRIP